MMSSVNYPKLKTSVNTHTNNPGRAFNYISIFIGILFLVGAFILRKNHTLLATLASGPDQDPATNLPVKSTRPPTSGFVQFGGTSGLVLYTNSIVATGFTASHVNHLVTLTDDELVNAHAATLDLSLFNDGDSIRVVNSAGNLTTLVAIKSAVRSTLQIFLNSAVILEPPSSSTCTVNLQGDTVAPLGNNGIVFGNNGFQVPNSSLCKSYYYGVPGTTDSFGDHYLRFPQNALNGTAFHVMGQSLTSPKATLSVGLTPGGSNLSFRDSASAIAFAGEWYQLPHFVAPADGETPWVMDFLSLGNVQVVIPTSMLEGNRWIVFASRQPCTFQFNLGTMAYTSAKMRWSKQPICCHALQSSSSIVTLGQSTQLLLLFAVQDVSHRTILSWKCCRKPGFSSFSIPTYEMTGLAVPLNPGGTANTDPSILLAIHRKSVVIVNGEVTLPPPADGSWIKLKSPFASAISPIINYWNSGKTLITSSYPMDIDSVYLWVASASAWTSVGKIM